MKNRKCRLIFHTYGKFVLDTFANVVKVGVYSNPSVFINVSVTEANFTLLLNDFNLATADYNIYGKTKRTVYLVAKEKLINAIDLLASDVDKIANGDESIILLAGFTPTAASSLRNAPIEKIQEVTVKNTMVSGQIIIETPPVAKNGAVFYGAICSEGTPLGHNDFVDGQITINGNGPKIIFNLNKSRKKVISGCTPGAHYYVYLFAVNAVGVSPLSDPKTIWSN
ncbi:hypothetical protein OX284_002035 [Flavobacterium sp. SUN046]|uniref:hypothetical protein n=1 Tax=Flavobacterium sp. SUN046 TaxID=3002440 RepID=UPI002DB63225|nr:hypothetical protein [Flavobacterium sp. SUN046]MEC4048194.1 hypothetical protein [Flavobacterium sp. SUN046]